MGLGCQWAFLLVTLIVSSALGQPAGMHVLAAGLVASRFGLWSFDLAVSQMLQERVPNEQLGMPLLHPAARKEQLSSGPGPSLSGWAKLSGRDVSIGLTDVSRSEAHMQIAYQRKGVGCSLPQSYVGYFQSTCEAVYCSGQHAGFMRRSLHQVRTLWASAGVVNGMQSSLQSLLGSLSFGLVLLVWQPQLFVVLMAGSVLVVSASLALYLYFTGAKDWLSACLGGQQSYQAMHAGPQEQA